MPDSKHVAIGGTGESAESSRASSAGPSSARVPVAERYEARLARSILAGGPGAAAAARALLEHSDPPTLDTAVAMLAAAGGVTEDAFDLLADAWETYRHVKHLSWD